MNPDDEVCLCFHVSRRKIENYLRIERPSRVGQLSECFGAGTGCGWCRPYLQRMFDQASEHGSVEPMPTAEQYAEMRQKYLRKRDHSSGDSPDDNRSSEGPSAEGDSERR